MALPTITKKQQAILLLIYNFRFIDRKQIQTILNHKNHRRIHSWLSGLVINDCIGKIYSKNMPDNTKPAVYYLGKQGRKILKHYFCERYADDTKQMEAMLYQLTKTYKGSQRTKVFRANCLSLVDCSIAITRYYEENIGYDILFSSLTECATYPLLKKFDSYVSLQRKRGKVKRYVFLYITNRTPRRFIRYRISEIIKFLEQEWGYETDQPYPSVLCVCSNFPIRNYIKKVWETKLAYYNHPEITVHLTTLHEFKEKAMDPSIWVEPKNDEEY